MQWGPQAHRDRLVQLVPKVMQARQAPQERMVPPERKVRQVRQGHEVKGDQRGHRVFQGRLVRQVLRVKRGHRALPEGEGRWDCPGWMVKPDHRDHRDHRDHKGQPEGWYPGKFTASEHTLLPH